jgi:hypothetical protein
MRSGRILTGSRTSSAWRTPRMMTRAGPWRVTPRAPREGTRNGVNCGRGAGAAYSASVLPPGDAFWVGSGLARTVVTTGGSEAVTYQSIDSGMQTITLYCYSANKLFRLIGCVVQPKLSVEVYKRGFLDFDVTGKIAVAPIESAIPSPLTFNQVVPPEFVSAAVSIGSWNQSSTEPLALISASYDFGTAIADLSSAGATDGLAGWLITDRNATQEMVVNAMALATFDPFAQARLGGANPLLTAWQIGNVQYNRMQFNARWTPRAPREGTRNGVKTYTLSGPSRVGVGLIGGREALIVYN